MTAADVFFARFHRFAKHLNPPDIGGGVWDLEFRDAVNIIRIVWQKGEKRESATIAMDGTVTASSVAVRKTIEKVWSETQ